MAPSASQPLLNSKQAAVNSASLQTSLAETNPQAIRESTSQTQSSQLTVPSSCKVMTGGVLSSMVNVAVVVLVLPQSSVALKITRSRRVVGQRASVDRSESLQVTSPQLSVAVAPPLFAIHVSNAVTLPAPSHSTVSSIASVTIGGVLSIKVMVWVQLIIVSLSQWSMVYTPQVRMNS